MKSDYSSFYNTAKIICNTSLLRHKTQASKAFIFKTKHRVIFNLEKEELIKSILHFLHSTPKIQSINYMFKLSI